MKWTCQGKSALLSSSQRYKGLVQLWSLRTWTQIWSVSHYFKVQLNFLTLRNLKSIFRLFINVEEQKLICQHCVFSQCQRLLWKAALDHPHPLVPGQRQTTDHRAVLLIRLVQVHVAKAQKKLSILYQSVIINSLAL